MNSNLLKAADKLTFAISDIEKLLRTTAEDNNSFEDIQAIQELEYVIDQMRNAVSGIKHYSKPVKEGNLIELPNGRFEIAGAELTCGCALEVYSPKYKEWFAGRVEHNGSYYFYCNDLGHPVLYTGMKARIRV